MKRTIFLAATLALALVMAVSGTVAYLQDTDEDVNVMVLGNVDIEQHEMQRKPGVEYNAGEAGAGNGIKLGDLVPYKNGQPLYPAYPVVGETNPYTAEMDTANLFFWGDYVYSGTAGNGLWNDAKLKGAMDKFVFVENTGKSDAYFRTWIAFECPEGMAYSQGSDKEFMNNTNTGELYTWTDIEGHYDTIDGTRYMITCATYKNALKPGQWAHPSLLQVVMTHNADNDDMKKLGDTYEILVLTQAVQTNNFTSAEQALTAAFGSDHPWKTEDGKNEDYNVAGTNVSNADELIEALEAGDHVALTGDVKIDPAGMSNAYGKTGINVKNGQTIDGNGYTLDIKGAGGTWDSGINTTGGLIKDITVTGSFRGIFINHNSDFSEPVILDGVTIDGTTYTISCDQGMNQTLIAKDSTFKGWTSYAATLGNASFTNCYFGEGNGYAYMRPYCPTTYVGCEFEKGFEIDPCATIEFVNCTLDGQPLTNANLATLVAPYYGKAENATVK